MLPTKPEAVEAPSEMEEVKATVLLFGDSGTGKNTCIATILKAGHKVRLLAVDPNAEIGMRSGFEHHKLTPEQISNFGAVNLTLGRLGDGKKALTKLKDLTKSTSQLTAAMIEKQPPDPKKSEKTQLLKLAEAMESFSTARGGQYGNVNDWGNDTWLVVDGLTTLSRAAQNTIVGDQLTMSQSNFQAAQNLLKLYALTFLNLKCNHLLLAHADQVKDELSGSVKIFPLSIGPSISNWLPGNYGDVIYSYREGDKFKWSTRHTRAVTRCKLSAPGNELDQDFAPLIKKLQKLDKPLF